MFVNGKGKQKRLTSYFSDEQSHPRSTVSKKRHRSSLLSSNSFRSKNGGSGFGLCPLCQCSFSWHILESHASECAKIESNPGIIERTIASDNDKSSPKPSSIPTVTSMDNDQTNRFSPMNKIQELQHLKSATKTETTASTRNIITPRLAPIFQAKSKGEIQNNQQALHSQQHLRPQSYEPIPGLFVYEDFITEEEEALILKGCVDVGREVVPAWKHCRFNGKHIGKRWGVHCNLRDRRVDNPEHPLPDVLQTIIFPKLKALNLVSSASMKNFCPNEANAIDYRRREGHWLQAHVDDRKLSKETIANLSLVGDCYMAFRNVARHRNLEVPEKRVLLRRRCLQVLTGRARYDFTHGIDNTDLLSDRRVSITMRESPLTATAQNQSTSILSHSLFRR